MVKRVAVFGGSFNPPGVHHRAIAQMLSEKFDEVLIVPCGPRPDKQTVNDMSPIYRAAMADMAFRDLDNVHVELFDLEQASFTRTHELQTRFADRGELWHVVGADLIKGGAQGRSRIHDIWHKGAQLWDTLNFAVVTRDGVPIEDGDLPRKHCLLGVNSSGSSTEIRERLFKRQPFKSLVTEEVATYIERYGLYRGRIPGSVTRFDLPSPRLLVEFDPWNQKARDWATRFESLAVAQDGDPNAILVIGGDGSMLRAIRKHWRLRLPFFGVNAGHLGFLLNNAEDVFKRAFPPASFMLHRQPLIYTAFERADGEEVSGLGFNDAWLERSTGQSAWLEVAVNGRVRFEKLVCDGVLFSTPAGSTAYARAMGATPLLADTPAWLMVGSNVLTPRNWKSALISYDAEVTVQNLHTSKRPIQGFIDGIPQGEVVSMKARISRTASVELAFLPHHDMAEKIARIQFPS